VKSDLEPTSVSIVSPQLIKTDEYINIKKASADEQSLFPSSLADQLKAMHERLRSSAQTQIEAVKIVSNLMLKRDRIESTLNLVHQVSLHSIDDLSTKEIQTIPSVVLDLLKMDMMTENVYQSIKQNEITPHLSDLTAIGNLSKTIIEGIQIYQLNLPQIHKIQTQLLTPTLIGNTFSKINSLYKPILEEFKSGRLSKRVLDVYKSHSPLEIFNKIRSSATQLKTLLLQQSSISAQSSLFDTTRVSSTRQAATKDIPAVEKRILNTDQST
jgi:hypothetical protein